ncbi:MAG: hypothetical protein P4M13_03445 [Alphaproteobacteria bacterium]|nr:hypothetical protein [Alphaproteobacteria bacterium]
MNETLNESFHRPLNGFSNDIAIYAAKGMVIVPCDDMGHPKQLRKNLSLTAEDFVVCAFMASRRPEGMPGLPEVVYHYSRTLATLNKDFNAHMPGFSGGGKVSNTPEKDGLMAQWIRGATEVGYPAYCLITEDLARKEGLPLKPGRALVLKKFDGEHRIGARTDGLVAPTELFVNFPGGTGSELENCAIHVNYSISPEFSRRKTLYYDPLVYLPGRKKASRYFNIWRAKIVQDIMIDTIGPKAAQVMNNNCFIHQPHEDLSPEEACREFISLTLAIRQATPHYDPHAGYGPLSDEIVREYMFPFIDGNKGSKVVKLLKNLPADWSDVDNLRCLRKPTHKVARPYHL